MKCIDFDKEFQRYITVWMKEHAKDYKNVEAMENAMPEVYATFLDTPQAFIAGMKPGEYFLSFKDPKALVNWMEDYFKQRVPVPDMLLNRIGELGEESVDALVNLIGKERTPQDAKMCAVTLLREIGTETPMQMFVDWQLNRKEDDEMADNALECLESLGEKAYGPMRAAMEKANDAGKEALLSLLCDGPSDDGLFDMAMALLQARKHNCAVLSDYISRLGDERALPELKRLAADDTTTYLDYIELRSAIEKLGGECPERDFDDRDPMYEALSRMQ
jgi:hypothetical protein